MIDLNTFYNDGFVVVSLQQKFADLLTKLVKEEKQWAIDDEEGFLTPDWMQQGVIKASDNPNPYEREFLEKKNIFELTPTRYKKFFNILFGAESPYLKPLITINESTLKITSIFLWNGATKRKGQSLEWHWDGPGNDDIFVLLYLNNQEKTWKSEYGGNLEMTKAQLTKNGDYVLSEESNIQEVITHNGTLIIGDNRNPLIVHRATQLTSQAPKNIEKFTFLITLKLDRNYAD